MVEGFSNLFDLFSTNQRQPLQAASAAEKLIRSRYHSLTHTCSALPAQAGMLFFYQLHNFVKTDSGCVSNCHRNGFLGVLGGGGTPGPFSNPAVKPASADG